MRPRRSWSRCFGCRLCRVRAAPAARAEARCRAPRHSGGARPARTWLLRITRSLYDLQERYLAQLAQAGIICAAATQGLFSAPGYALLVPAHRHALGERLRQITLTDASCFRIGTIGRIFPRDVRSLLAAIRETLDEMGVVMQRTEAR